MNSLYLLLLAVVAVVRAAPLEKRASSNLAGIPIPAQCLKKNGLSVGWYPDEDNGFQSISTITNAMGPACFYGLYSHFGADLSVANSDILGQKLQDVKQSGAIAVLSFQPSAVPFGQITDAVAAQVANVVKQYTNEGIYVLIRFAHEMNLYHDQGYYQGTSTEFQAAWKRIWQAVQGNPKAKMYWCPNTAQSDTLWTWWPEDKTVDVVGLDGYKFEATDTFKDHFLNFHYVFAAGKKKPMLIGETGSKNDAWKKGWLEEVISFNWLPNLVGFLYFEYNKASEGDFRVATGGYTFAEQVLK